MFINHLLNEMILQVVVLFGAGTFILGTWNPHLWKIRQGGGIHPPGAVWWLPQNAWKIQV